jgi:hypothetical protein
MNDILENKIIEIGREIYRLMERDVPSLFDRKSLNGNSQGDSECLKSYITETVPIIWINT